MTASFDKWRRPEPFLIRRAEWFRETYWTLANSGTEVNRKSMTQLLTWAEILDVVQ
jgi:hypothetical protein